MNRFKPLLSLYLVLATALQACVSTPAPTPVSQADREQDQCEAGAPRLPASTGKFSKNQCVAIFASSKAKVETLKVPYQVFAGTLKLEKWLNETKVNPNDFTFTLVSEGGKPLAGTALRKRLLRETEEYTFEPDGNYERVQRKKKAELCSRTLGQKFRMMKMAALIALPLALSACSGGPTTEEAAGLQQQFTHELERAGARNVEMPAFLERYGGVWRGTDGFIVDKGFIYRVNSAGKLTFMEGTSGVESLLLFKNTLFLTADGGDIYAFREEGRSSSNRWIRVGSYAKKLVTDGTTLYAVAHTEAGMVFNEWRTVFAFSESIRWERHENITQSKVGDVTVTNIEEYWTLGDNRSPFRDLKISDAADLEVRGGKVDVQLVDGSRIPAPN